MSDLSQITRNEQQQQKQTSLLNDQLQTISISDNDNDSEYEDVEENDVNDRSILPSRTKNPDDGDDLYIDIKPRRMNKKQQDDEHSEGYEDDDNDNQNVPKVNVRTQRKKDLLDDDNNSQSPAYIPRKGRFYEHDDRTLDNNDQPKQEITRYNNRLYKDTDGKWQHDLYFQDQQISKSRYPNPRQSYTHFQYRNTSKPEQLHLTDYMPRSQQGYTNNYHQPSYSNNYHQRIPYETTNKFQTNRINNYELNRNNYNKDAATPKVTLIKPRQPQNDNNPYKIDERIFHRRRNFTNSLFQQQGNSSDQRRFNKQSNENQYRNLRRYDFYENKMNLPPRLQNRNLTTKQQNSFSNISAIERPKRYSNMRNAIQQQNQRYNNIEQNDWPQAPPPPTSQLYYQQPTSRYIPMNYSQTSMSEQVSNIGFSFKE